MKTTLRTFLEEKQTVEMVSGSDFYSDRTINHDDVEKRIRYLSWKDAQHEELIIVRSGNKIIGVAGLEKAPREEEWWIKFVSVDPDHRNSGVGKILVDEIFKFASKNKLNLRASSYTEMGAKYLKRVVDAAHEKYSDVPFKDQTDHTRF